MKKSYLLALVMILVAGAIVLRGGEADIAPYSNFTEAAVTDGNVKLVGTLVKDKPMEYDPLVNPDLFSFYLKDDDGTERKVNLLMAKPKDFEMSESIVLTGKMIGDDFLAEDIQMKCPSKYKDEESMIKELTQG